MWDSRPFDWEVKRLSDIASRVTRKNDGAGHPLMTISAKKGFMLQSDKYSRDMAGQSAERYTLLKRGEFAYNKGNSQTAPQGCIFKLEQNSAIVPFVYYCFSLKSNIDREFAALAFQNGVLNRDLARAINSGVRNDGLLNLPVEDFFRSQIALPPLAEQRAIAEVLGALEESIVKTEALIGELETTRAAIIETNLANLRENLGSHGIRRLRDIAQVRTGIAKSKDRVLVQPISVPYLRVANVQDGYLDLQEVKYIQVERAQLARYSLKHGDVLFNEGGDFDKLGRGCVWNCEIPDCVHQNHVFAVRCSAKVVPEFLAILASSRAGKAYFRLSSKQTTNLASINTSDLRSFPVLLPSLDEQWRIAAIGTLFDRRIAAEKQVLAQLSDLKNALAQELLSGRLRLPESMIARHRDKPERAA